MTREVLDQDAEEAFHRPADGTVHHDRLLLFRIRADVERTETLRQVEVDLRCAALPFPADRIPQRVLELRAVERTFARQDIRLDAPARLLLDLLEHARHDLFGVIPVLVGTDALFGTCRQLDHDLLEAEVLIDRQDQVVDLQALCSKLLLGAEDVRIVLRKAANAHQPVQCAGGLVAMDGPEFGKAYRKFAIGLQSVLEDLHVAGAVHRLQREDALILCILAG